MEMSFLPLALSPEQLAAFNAGHSVVHAEDPATGRKYILIDEQPRRLTVDELTAMLLEGIDELDRGEGVPWDAEQIKQSIWRHLSLQRKEDE